MRLAAAIATALAVAASAAAEDQPTKKPSVSALEEIIVLGQRTTVDIAREAQE